MVETLETQASEIHQLVDHLFRREAGKIASRLTYVFGAHRLDLVEDAVQYSMLQALQLWPYRGVPNNPGAWLMRVASNRALDMVKSEKKVVSYEDGESAQVGVKTENFLVAGASSQPRFSKELPDEELSLMFLCCHPILPRSASVVLTLKVACGLGVEEIARAFLTTETTVAQRLVRAKRLIREQRIWFEVPGPAELPSRLDSILEVLYLFFTEGYAPTAGDCLIKADLCAEAIRLATLLTENPATSRPECHALLALMLFQGARFASRTDAAGELLLLEDQDRSLWDKSMMARGFLHLEQSGQGQRLTPYHLQAEIAAVHTCADRFDQTDWAHILSLYDLLSGMQPTPVVLVNRAVAVAQVKGPEAGLAALALIETGREEDRYPAILMAAGEFHRRLGDAGAAVKHLARALMVVRTEPERRFVARRLAALRNEQ